MSNRDKLIKHLQAIEALSASHSHDGKKPQTLLRVARKHGLCNLTLNEIKRMDKRQARQQIKVVLDTINYLQSKPRLRRAA